MNNLMIGLQFSQRITSWKEHCGVPYSIANGRCSSHFTNTYFNTHYNTPSSRCSIPFVKGYPMINLKNMFRAFKYLITLF